MGGSNGRVPKVALGPLALAIVFLLWWSARGAPRAVERVLSGEERITDVSFGENVVVADEETSVNAHVTIQNGRNVFTPFVRAPRGTNAGTSFEAQRAITKTGGDDDLNDASFERVRQVIDDSHLPSLPPFPPAGPPEPDQQSYEESESNLYDQTVTLETKRVTGGEFKWSRPKNNIETNRHQKR